MRETKDQKIIRLSKKIEKLENEIKELKSSLRKVTKVKNKENQINLNEMEKTKKKEELLLLERDSLMESNEIKSRKLLDLKREKETYNSRFITVLNELFFGLKNYSRIANQIKNLDEKALEYFGYDEVGVSRYNEPFFDLDTYIVNIHPIYGYSLSPMEKDYIKKMIFKDPVYENTLYSTKKLRKQLLEEKYRTDISLTSEFHKIGKELMNKLYLHVFFNYKDVKPFQELIGFKRCILE